MDVRALPAVTLRQVESLVDMPYVAGRFTCLHLAVWAQEKLYGRLVGDEALRRLPVRGARQAALIQQWRSRLADPVKQPSSGDLVLFNEPDGEWQWHIGTLFVEQGERWVLHTHQGIGASVLERLQDAQLRGLVLEGFYRWRSVQERTCA